MYYMQRIYFQYDQKITEYWAFDKVTDKDQAVLSSPTAYTTNKKDIPDDKEIKRFHHFKESFSGLFLFPQTEDQ